jgi:hypothetical protein
MRRARTHTLSHPQPRNAPHKRHTTPLAKSGDNSDGAAGAFFEGVVLKGASSEAADAEVKADLNGFYSKASLGALRQL